MLRVRVLDGVLSESGVRVRHLSYSSSGLEYDIAVHLYGIFYTGVRSMRYKEASAFCMPLYDILRLRSTVYVHIITATRYEYRMQIISGTVQSYHGIATGSG